MKRRTLLQFGLCGMLWPLCGCQLFQTEELPLSLRLYCFQAGKADALLLTTARSAVLIDTGEKGFGKEITAYLEEQGIAELDCLIVTHFDKDHVGGAAKVLKSVPVKQVLQSNCPKDSDEYENYIEALAQAGLSPLTVREELSFTLDGVQYTVNPPRQESYPQDASNNSSLILSVRCGEVRLLLTGDAEDARMAEFLSVPPGRQELVKLPHHGRWQDTLPALLAATQPEYAVVTCSDEEPEAPETAALLEQMGVKAFLTRKGPILAVSDGKALEIGYQ